MPDRKRQNATKDDDEHSTTTSSENTGDSGREPGTAEGDRANVDKWLHEQKIRKDSGRPQK